MKTERSNYYREAERHQKIFIGNYRFVDAPSPIFTPKRKKGKKK